MTCCSHEPPERRALTLVEESETMESGTSVKHYIASWQEEKRNEVKPLGWSVERKGDQTFLVAYRYEIHSLTQGVGVRGFFFEVDLGSGVVRNVTEQRVRLMPPLQPIYQSESDMVKELLDKPVVRLEEAPSP